MFSKYPDIVNIKQLRQMLGGIGVTLSYRLLKQEKIKAKKVGRDYRIPKINVINYLQGK